MSEHQKKCFIDSCPKDPFVFCNCQENPSFICTNHTLYHCELEGQHLYEKIYSEVHEDTRNAVLKHFYQLKSDLLENYESKIIQTELSLANQTHNITQNTLQKLEMQGRKLDEYIYQINIIKEIDNSKPTTFIESLLKLSPEDLSRLKTIKSPELIIRNIDSCNFKDLFILDEIIEEHIYIEKQYINGPHIMKFFKNHDPATLCIFDAKRLRVYDFCLETDKTFDQFEANYQLPDGSLFYDDFYQAKAVLVEPDLHIKNLAINPVRCTTPSAVYFKREIYLFGGSDDISLKYSIDKNKWSPLSYLPMPFEKNTVSAVFKSYILIGSTINSSIAFYDTAIDSYNEILHVNRAVRCTKAFVIDNETAYLIIFSLTIYKSSDNLMTWDIIGDCSHLLSYLPLVSSPITYDNKSYFANYYGIYLFDLRKFNIDRIISFKK